MRTRRPKRSRLPRASYLVGGLLGDGGVGFSGGIFPFAAMPVFCLWALGSIAVLSVTRVTAISHSSATIRDMLGAAFPRGLVLLATPMFPTALRALLGPLRLTIGHPGIKIFRLGRRIHIRRFADILPRCIAAGKAETDWKAGALP